MEKDFKTNNNELTVTIKGRLDTKTSPELEGELSDHITEEIDTVIFDFKDLSYISSSGLRLMVNVMKLPGPVKRKVKVLNIEPAILEILEATGLDDFMELEI